MSGLVVWLQWDGWGENRPVSPHDLLPQWQTYLNPHGPDAQVSWHDQHVALVHTHLATTDTAQREHYPLSYDNQTWLIAEARIDNRVELMRQLDLEQPADPTDADLIWWAYQAWGADCVAALRGDFVFIIWDSQQKRLLAGRDQLGVRQLYWVALPAGLLLSNDLHALRLHPHVTDQLNEAMIADYLLFGEGQSVSDSFWADIQQVPPAHYLLAIPEQTQLRRYWTLPVEPAGYDYDPITTFQTIFHQAIHTRLRTTNINILLSGGLDSASIAAVASQQSGSTYHALTVGYQHLFADAEPDYARQVAESLAMPQTIWWLDEYALFDEAMPWARFLPAPTSLVFIRSAVDVGRQMAGHGRVVLSGDGGDPAQQPTSFYWWQLWRQGKIGRFWHQYRRSRQQLGYWPPLRLRSLWRHYTQKPPALPAWLQPDFERRQNLAERWQTHHQRQPLPHPNRPEAYAYLTDPIWPHFFATVAALNHQFGLVSRYPFFDLSLLQLLLRTPAVPWFEAKFLLRQAISGYLPEAIRTRPKSPLGDESIAQKWVSVRQIWLPRLAKATELTQFLDWSLVQKQAATDYQLAIHLINLHLWLQSKA